MPSLASRSSAEAAEPETLFPAPTAKGRKKKDAERYSALIAKLGVDVWNENIVPAFAALSS